MNEFIEILGNSIEILLTGAASYNLYKMRKTRSKKSTRKQLNAKFNETEPKLSAQRGAPTSNLSGTWRRYQRLFTHVSSVASSTWIALDLFNFIIRTRARDKSKRPNFGGGCLQLKFMVMLIGREHTRTRAIACMCENRLKSAERRRSENLRSVSGRRLKRKRDDLKGARHLRSVRIHHAACPRELNFKYRSAHIIAHASQTSFWH